MALLGADLYVYAQFRHFRDGPSVFDLVVLSALQELYYAVRCRSRPECSSPPIPPQTQNITLYSTLQHVSVQTPRHAAGLHGVWGPRGRAPERPAGAGVLRARAR